MKKRIFSAFLAALLALSALAVGSVFTSAAKPAADRAMLLDDISVPDASLTGAMGYIVNTSSDNDYGVKKWGSDEPYAVDDSNGISVAFDLNVIAFSQCNHLVSEIAPNDFKHVQGLVFTFSNSDGFQAIIYDAVKQEFQIANVGWPTSVVPVNGSHIVAKAPYPMEPGEWHRCYYNIDATMVSVYCDGELVVSHDFSGGPKNTLNRSFLMFWESHVRLMMDNLIVGTFEYDDTEDAEYNEGTILFADDFNDAADVVYDFTENAQVWEYQKDADGNVIEFPVYEEDGITPKLDEKGKPITEKRYALDGEGQKIPARNEKGELITEQIHHFLKDGEPTTDPSQEHAGFVFGNGSGSGSSSMNVPCRGVDKESYCGMLTDREDAVISFADCEAIEGQTVYSSITIAEGSPFTSAQNLIISLDPIFTFRGFDNYSNGVTVSVDEYQNISIIIPEGFSGKLADIVLEIPAETEMAQSCKYRFGFLVGKDTEFKNGETPVDPSAVTVDGGFVATKNYIKGDVDSSGKVNMRDVALLMKYNVVMAALKRAADKTPTPEQQKIIDAVLIKAADVFPDGSVSSRDTSVLNDMMLAKSVSTSWDGEYASPLTFRAEEITVEYGTQSAEFDVVLENVPEIGVGTAFVNVKIPGAKITDAKKAGVSSGTWKSNTSGDSVNIILVDVSKGIKKDLTFAHIKLDLPAGMRWSDELPIIVTPDADPDNFTSFDEVEGDTVALGAIGVNGKICVEACEHSIVHVGAVEATAEADGCIEHWKCDICGDLFADKAGTTPLTPEQVVVKYEKPGEAENPGDVNGDGKINAKDVTAIMRHIIGKTPEGFDLKAADFNGDGKINAKDVTGVMKRIVSGK